MAKIRNAYQNLVDIELEKFSGDRKFLDVLMIKYNIKINMEIIVYKNVS